MSTMQYLLPFMKLVCMTIVGKTAVDVKGRNSLEIIGLSRRSARSSTSSSAAWAGRTGDLDLDLDLDLVFFLAEEDVALDFSWGALLRSLEESLNRMSLLHRDFRSRLLILIRNLNRLQNLQDPVLLINNIRQHLISIRTAIQSLPQIIKTYLVALLHDE